MASYGTTISKFIFKMQPMLTKWLTPHLKMLEIFNFATVLFKTEGIEMVFQTT